LGEFIQQFAGNYIAAEGAFWRTLKLLLFRPGAITREYLDGRRRRYVLPLRLYLTVSVLVLLLVKLGVNVDVNTVNRDFPTEMPRHLEFNMGIWHAGLRDGTFFCEGLPQSLCKRIQKRIDIAPSQIVSEVSGWAERFVAHLGGAMFLLMPSFAMWMLLVYRNRRLHYTEHLVFALHLHTFWFIMLGCAQIPFEPVKLLSVIAIPFYTLWAMATVYKGRFLPRLLRAGLVTFLYGITMAVAMTGVAMWAVLF
jgi:hypothetical protein